MNKADHAALEGQYNALERRWTVAAGSDALAEAVQFRSNRQRAVHRWFHFKEGFSANIFEALGLGGQPLAKSDAVFVDPFCGCGTSLLAGDLQHGWLARRIGVEINPFVAFVARTKTQWRQYDPDRIAAAVDRILAMPLDSRVPRDRWPALSTFARTDMFSAATVSALVDAVERVAQIPTPERDLLLLGVAGVAERVSYFRKDGRALRILRTSGELNIRRRLQVTTELRTAWMAIADDLRALADRRGSTYGDCSVLEGDGRSLDVLEAQGVRNGEVTCMLYSPPYLNHIDYTEVYKVELWLLGFARTQIDMLSLRKQTLRSHASIGVREATRDLPEAVEDALCVVTKLVSADGTAWHRKFGELARAYLVDMRAAFRRQMTLLSSGACAVCIVANSAHGSRKNRVPIASDLLLAAIAQEEGFQIDRLMVARQLRRRNHLNRYLRETALVLRKPST